MGGKNAKHAFALTCLKSVLCNKNWIILQLSNKLIKIHKCWQFETCLSPANFVNYIMFSFFKCSGRNLYWFSNSCSLSLELIDPFSETVPLKRSRVLSIQSLCLTQRMSYNSLDIWKVTFASTLLLWQK